MDRVERTLGHQLAIADDPAADVLGFLFDLVEGLLEFGDCVRHQAVRADFGHVEASLGLSFECPVVISRPPKGIQSP